MQSKVVNEDDRGKGRTFVLLYERQNQGAAHRTSYLNALKILPEVLSETSRVLSLSTPYITASNWKQNVEAVSEELQASKVRQFSLICFGGAGTVAQYLYLKNFRSVRTLISVDVTSRPHPGSLEKLFDKVERYLPLGLPFRSRGEGFDASPFLNRVRCPSLVVVSPEATAYEKAEALTISRALPTSWHLDLSSEDAWATLPDHILSFQNIPVKCPQKNLKAAS